MQKYARSDTRYAAQEIAIGGFAQKKIQDTVVGIVGLGGIGGFTAMLVAQMGVKKIVAADADIVENCNLGRQILFVKKDVGKQKAVVAKEILKKINSEVKIETFAKLVDDESIGLFDNCQIILDCTDNYETRLTIDRYCKKRNIPWIYAGAIKTKSMAIFVSPKGKRFEKMAKKPKNRESCSRFGVLNATCARSAAMQVLLLVKWAQGKEDCKPRFAEE